MGASKPMGLNRIDKILICSPLLCVKR